MGGTLESWDSMYRMKLRTAVSCSKAGSARIVDLGALIPLSGRT